LYARTLPLVRVNALNDPNIVTPFGRGKLPVESPDQLDDVSREKTESSNARIELKFPVTAVVPLS
jgi:energy-converting hydrogenase Eha subunit F